MGTFLTRLAKQQPRLIGRTFSPFEKPRAIVLWLQRRGPRGSSPWESPLQPLMLLLLSPGSLSPTELHAQSERSWVRSQTCLVSSISKDNRDASSDAQVTPSGSLLWRHLAWRDQNALHCGCTWSRPIPCPQTGSKQHPCRNPKTVHYQGWDFNQSFRLGSRLPMMPPC